MSRRGGGSKVATLRATGETSQNESCAVFPRAVIFPRRLGLKIYYWRERRLWGVSTPLYGHSLNCASRRSLVYFAPKVYCIEHPAQVLPPWRALQKMTPHRALCIRRAPSYAFAPTPVGAIQHCKFRFATQNKGINDPPLILGLTKPIFCPTFSPLFTFATSIIYPSIQSCWSIC